MAIERIQIGGIENRSPEHSSQFAPTSIINSRGFDH
jgi:hypothetical protein